MFSRPHGGFYFGSPFYAKPAPVTNADWDLFRLASMGLPRFVAQAQYARGVQEVLGGGDDPLVVMKQHYRAVDGRVILGLQILDGRILLPPRPEWRFIPERLRRPDAPVVFITWYQAATYCAWYGEQVRPATGGYWRFRLPQIEELRRVAYMGMGVGHVGMVEIDEWCHGPPPQVFGFGGAYSTNEQTPERAVGRLSGDGLSVDYKLPTFPEGENLAEYTRPIAFRYVAELRRK